ncbi:MAG TPA: nicotinate (nicotinamide) nucleotide adenylyltransferase [Desulfobacteraceae bacterium]|nr:nicotinate (nicotinamide) nucleotide adenylyltransferase [Desulfobacteraceae bacterium]
MRIGILGGTFDPVHIAHLRVCEEVAEEIQLDKVYLVPAYIPPHKGEKSITDFSHRLKMLKLAVSTSPLLDVLDLEGKRVGISYTVPTLEELNRIFGDSHTIYFIMGMDAFLEIETWYRYRDIFSLTELVVISRPGYVIRDISNHIENLGVECRKVHNNIIVLSSGRSLTYVATTYLDISSSKIRKMIREGRSIRFLVTEDVRRYIEERGLYI